MAEHHLDWVPKHRDANLLDEDDDNPLHQSPYFQLRRETTHAELFYDLFFVANLTVFTFIHDVSDLTTLAQYITFFCTLWFTWYQVALFDVRFARDCVATRFWKALQSAFMIAFAAVGPMFKLGKGVDERGRSINEYLQVLTLALMGTRAALICQYLQTLLLCRKFKGVKLPLAITASIYGTSSITYGLLAISFDGKEAHWTWIVWYIVGAVESILVTLVSSICRNVSFKRTHLVQRMSLLTLIILGEGAISVAKQCQTLAKADTFPWNATNIIDIICAVLILYFLYMIYFDWIEEHGDFGAIREQIWACLHFFLHLALVLAVQGLKLCILWSAAIAAVKTKHLALTWSQSPSGGFANVTNATDRTQTAWHWYNLAEPIVIDQGYNIKTYAGALDTETDLLRLQKARDYIIVNGSSDAAGAEAALDVMKYTASKSVFTMAGFKKLDLIKAEEDWNLTLTHPSNSSVGSIYGPLSDNASSIDGTFDLTFCYFFTATGFTVLMCALMACFSQTLKRPYHWIRLGFSAVVGSTLCLMATMVVGENETYTHFTMSSWLLPTVTILLAMVVLLNNVTPFFPSLEETGRSSSEKETSATAWTNK